MCQLTSMAGPNVSGSSGPASKGPVPQTLNVSVGYSGCGNNAIAEVSFDDNYTPAPDPNLHIPNPPSGCSKNVNPGVHVEQWTCTSAVGNVGITSSCVYPTPLTASCPSHYNLTGGTCEWDESGTAGQNCPAGTQYDPTHKCCTSAPGTGVNIPACPAGTFFQDMGGGNYECLPSQVACGVVPASATVGDPQAIQGQCGNSNPGSGNSGSGTCTAAQNYCNTYCKYGCKIDPATCKITYCNRG